MLTFLEVHFVIGIVLGACSLVVGLAGIPATSGYGGPDRGEARFILGAIFGAPLMPFLWLPALIFGVCRSLSGLRRAAEIPSLAERRRKREIARQIAREEAIRTRDRRIADLERQLGIG